MWKKNGKYALAGTLVLIYIAVLLISFDTSSASEWYKLFYVEQRMRFAVSEDTVKAYTLDTPVIYHKGENYLNQGCGWSGPDDKGSWATGQENECFFWLESAEKDCILSIEIASALDYHLSLYVNSQLVNQFQFQKGNNMFDIPAAALHKGFNSFLFVAREPVLPYNQIKTNSEVTRCQSFKVSSMLMKEKE